MADPIKIETGEGSPENVAFKLFQVFINPKEKPQSRKEVLDLYAECLHATKGYRDFPGR